MSSISSLYKSISGLRAAQTGLQVTGHNISNVNTEGYTRQQLLQSESQYLTIGSNGGYKMQLGLGVNCDEIRQIRDGFIDQRLRAESSVLNYYQSLNNTMVDIDKIFDEPYGDTLSDELNTFWKQLQKLSWSANGVEERLSFIKSSKALIEKINSIGEALQNEQDNLNHSVEASVKDINQIVDQIADYNEKISLAEASGLKANDYRDERNLLLDKLATYGSIQYYEDTEAQVHVKFEGHDVVNKQIKVHMKLESPDAQSIFKEPVWQDTGSSVYNFNEKISNFAENDTGKLKALMVARGRNHATKSTTWNDLALNDNYSVDESGNNFIIPTIEKKLNEFEKNIVQMVNEAFTGTGLGEHSGQTGVKVFIFADGGDETHGKVYVTGNLMINPELLEEGGHNKLGTVFRPEPGAPEPTTDAERNEQDNRLAKNLYTEWQREKEWYQDVRDAERTAAPRSRNSNVNDFYSEFMVEIGIIGNLGKAMTDSKSLSYASIENDRAAMSSVSQDEEFASMLKYQYAYNASARVITMIDSMLDTVINRI